MTPFDSPMVDYAISILRQHRMTYWMIRIFLPTNSRTLFALAYSYFRWLDDEIDDGPQDHLKKYALLERAHSALDGFGIKNPHLSEQCLLSLLSEAEKRRIPLHAPIRQMLESIELDYRRIGRIPSHNELNLLCELRVCSYLNTLRLLTDTLPLYEAAPDYGIACDEIHILRDMHLDYQKGIYNYSSEEAERYQLDKFDVADINWRKWLRNRHRRSGILLRKGIYRLLCKPSQYSALCLFNLIRYSALWLILYFKFI